MIVAVTDAEQVPSAAFALRAIVQSARFYYVGKARALAGMRQEEQGPGLRPWEVGHGRAASFPGDSEGPSNPEQP